VVFDDDWSRLSPAINLAKARFVLIAFFVARNQPTNLAETHHQETDSGPVDLPILEAVGPHLSLG
jgi:hypothetical protein